MQSFASLKVMDTVTWNLELSARWIHTALPYKLFRVETRVKMFPVIISSPLRVDICPIFSDTKHERNKLMESAYPKIKSFCQDLGYDFQVVDMRWGVRDQATDDNMGTEMCLRELQMCQKLSTGPNFVVSFFSLWTNVDCRYHYLSVCKTVIIYSDW